MKRTTLHARIDSYRSLPRIFKEYFGAAGIKKYAANTGWHFLQKFITLPISLITLAIVTRYLGPEQFGIWSYTLSLVGITGVLASFGIDDIVFRESAAASDEENNHILGSAFVIKFFGGLLSFFISAVAVYILDTDPLIRTMVIIMAAGFLFQPFNVLKTYFQARVQTKYSAVVVTTVFLATAALKICFALWGVNLLFFAYITIVESVLYSLLFVGIYMLRRNNVLYWKASWSTMHPMLISAFPLILSSISAAIYTRIDQVFLMQMVDETAVGVYSVGIRIAEYWFFIPSIIATSVFPSIVMLRKSNKEKYLDRTIELTVLMLAITSVGAVGIYFLGPYVIPLLFGAAYSSAIPILTLYAWAGPGVAINIALTKYLIAEDTTRWIFICSVFAMIINVVLNLLLIPEYGIYGAAVATLISNFLFSVPVLLLHKTRRSLSHALRVYFKRAITRVHG